MKRFVLLPLVLAIGCAKEGNTSGSKSSRSKKNKSLVSEQEAKLFDLAIPLGASVLKKQSTEDTYAYLSSMSVVDLAQFIEEEMISLGWKLVTKFIGKEASLVFEKPLKYSTVSIRPYSGKTLASFYNSNK